MVKSPREAARRALRGVLAADLHASRVLDMELARSGLDKRDTGLATELLYGTLRHLRRIDHAIAALAPRGIDKLSPKVLAVLRVGAYQILFLDRVPDHAAVDDAAAAAKSVGGPRIAGFVNGVLRKLARDGEPALPDPAKGLVDYLAHRDSLPHWIVRRMHKRLGREVDVATAAFAQPASMSIRVNTTRTTRDALLGLLRREAHGVHVVTSPLVPHGLLAEGLGAPAASQSFRDGLWTVQDVAAQLVAHLVDPAPDMRILDACAGVGGKATHLLQLTEDKARVEAVDISHDKLDAGRHTAQRLGLTNMHCRVSDLTTEPVEAGAYDAVVLDAPCTGLGVLRRHPEAKWRVRSGDVARMASLQETLLSRCAEAVKPGGILVYSVCTFTLQEGVEQIGAFLEAHDEFALDAPPVGQGPPCAPPWQRVTEGGYVTTWPHRHDADGFFAARLVRRA